MEEVIKLAALAEAFGQQPEAFVAQFDELDPATNQPKKLTPEELSAKVVAFAKSETSRFLTEGKRIGIRERMTDFEAKVRAKYQVQSNAEGEALVDQIVTGYTSKLTQLEADLAAAKVAAEGKGLKEMTSDEAKAFIVNHPFYNEQVAAEAQKVAAATKALEDFKLQVEQDKAMTAVERAGLKAFEEYRPIVPANSTIAETLRQNYLEHLKRSAQYKIEGDSVVPLDKNGEKVKDANFRELDFTAFANSILSKYYEQHPADPGKGTPGAPGGAQGGGPAIPDWSKMDQSAITDYVLAEKDSAKREILQNSALKFLDGK